MPHQAIETLHNQSVLTLKYDDDFGLLGFVRHQAGELCVTPIRDVYHRPSRHGCLGMLVRLYDIQSITIEEERMIAELSQSFVDLCGTQFHHALHRLFGRAPRWWWLKRCWQFYDPAQTPTR
jgi:hypothetical protein